jgi:broad specificity phosphatase PhoE
MGKFIFVRHGQSQANADGMLAKPDSPLTELGVKQARKTAKEVHDLGISVIACSTMLRAQQTAETIAGHLGIDLKHIRIVDELHERRLGKLEGTPKIHKSSWYDTIKGEADMEYRDDLIKRMQRCFNKLKDMSKEGLVLAVGHSCSGFYLLQISAGKTRFEDFDPHSQLNNADFIEVKF